MSGGIAGQKTGMVTVPQFLLDDSPALAKRLEKFEETRKAALAAVALVGKAENIANLEEQAVTELVRQDKITKQAKEDADTLVSDSKDEATKIVSKAKTRADKLLSSAEDKLAEAESQRVEATEIRGGLKGRAEQMTEQQKIVDAEEQSLNQRAAELDKREQELAQETAKFADLGEQIKSALE